MWLIRRSFPHVLFCYCFYSCSYYSIASKATLLKPTDLPVPADKFEEFFAESWEAALQRNSVFNALDACTHLDVDVETLTKYWVECQDAEKMVKFGGGFYCGLVSVPDKEPVYVFNGFFMNMRAKYVAPGTSIHYYSVSFPASSLPWSCFRSQVIGPTDPTLASATSLRGQILANWEALGLSSVPTVSDNGVHASASPLEGLAERRNWLKVPIADDHFGAQLLLSGVAEETVEGWCLDPRVGGVSVFDSFEDLDCTDALYKAVELNQVGVDHGESNMETENVNDLGDNRCVEQYDHSADYNQNRAFIFIKPHGNTQATQELVSVTLTSQGVEILEEGELTSAQIESDKLIDQQ